MPDEGRENLEGKGDGKMMMLYTRILLLLKDQLQKLQRRVTSGMQECEGEVLSADSAQSSVSGIKGVGECCVYVCVLGMCVASYGVGEERVRAGQSSAQALR